MGRVDLRDGTDTIGPALDTFPELFVSHTQWCHGAQAGDDYSFVLHFEVMGNES
jgi:hypothetical protein